MQLVWQQYPLLNRITRHLDYASTQALRSCSKELFSNVEIPTKPSRVEHRWNGFWLDTYLIVSFPSINCRKSWESFWRDCQSKTGNFDLPPMAPAARQSGFAALMQAHRESQQQSIKFWQDLRSSGSGQRFLQRFGPK
jgi:hypothetical protein